MDLAGVGVGDTIQSIALIDQPSCLSEGLTLGCNTWSRTPWGQASLQWDPALPSTSLLYSHSTAMSSPNKSLEQKSPSWLYI